MSVEDPPARLAPVLAVQGLDHRRAAATHAIAVDVEDLDRVVGFPVAGDVFVRRRRLMPVLDDRHPQRLATVLVAHPRFRERFDDVLDGRHIVDLVGEHLQLIDPAAAGGTLWGLGTRGDR